MIPMINNKGNAQTANGIPVYNHLSKAAPIYNATAMATIN